VPEAGNGDPISSWLNPTSILGGVLAVLTCAFVAAVFLTAEARRRGEPELEAWFRRRSQVTAAVTGVVALAGIAVLHADAPRLFDELSSRGLPLVLLSGVCGLAALLLVRRLAPRVVQGLAVLAVAAIIAGWGTAQYPYLLGTHTTIAAAAAPTPTLVALTVVAAAALAFVVPSIALLFVLAQRGRLETSH
jgi:cytochrome d ubiquinol oxidase subunit II